MSSLGKTSKTECIIAIDDSDSDDENNSQTNTTLDESVAQTLESLLDSIETLPIIDRIEERSVSTLTNKTNTNDNEVKSGTAPKDNYIKERTVRPIDDIEDIENLEVNIYYNESDDSDIDLIFNNNDEEDMEAEDCMVIHNLTDDAVVDKQSDDKAEAEADSDDECKIIEESDHRFATLLSQAINQSVTNTEEEVVDLSDDEECVIIGDTFSKLNKLSSLKDDKPIKSQNSPVYSSDSYIPFSQPSTSSGFSHSLASRKNNPESKQRSKASSNFSSIRDLFKRPLESAFYDTISYGGSTSVRSSEEDEKIPGIYEEPKASTSSDSIGSSNVEDIDLIAESVKLDRRVVQNVVNLIEDQCTVPFIVRYRQSAISGIDAERVRRINAIYNDLKRAKERAKEVESLLRKQDRLNPRLIAALNRCKNVFEVEHLFRLCRNECQTSEKYRNLGLTDSAVAVLGGKSIDPKHLVNRFASELDSVDAVTEGWASIISDIISKDCDVLEFLIAAYKQHTPTLQVREVIGKMEELNKDSNPKNVDLIQKYLRFRSFSKPINKLNAHSYMAIERGESIGILKVFIEFDTIILNKLIEYCALKWNRCSQHFLVNCVRIAFNNQLKPSLEDYIRWELKYSAHMTALDVFRNNVKHLLLEPPLRGEYVIGVDPGFDSGCKLAVVSPWGIPLECLILKLDRYHWDSSATTLRRLLAEHNCSIIALGNGSGCRQFEGLLHQKIKSGFFEPINVKYKVINESGVSYYSVTNAAKADLPHFPPHMIGAISIARRLIDPLSELVKVDPKRLQVGMYMRDIDESAVRKAFHEVAVECVSFCGVDVNVASIELLSKVAGLEPNVARMIKNKIERDGLITSRSQLRNIDGIGWKQFEQCAGFIKIMPTTRKELPIYRKNSDNENSSKRLATSTDDFDPLDSTIIHPESYSSANTYIELIGATKDEIGKQSIRNKITKCYSLYSLPEITQLCNTHPSNMKLIIEGLSNSIDFDYRINFAQIYVPEIQHFNDLTEGMNLKGRVVNVTPMGAFIDCGIVGGINAYLNAKECERHTIAVNDNLMVKIVSIERLLQRFKVSVIKIFKNNLKFT